MDVQGVITTEDMLGGITRFQSIFEVRLAMNMKLTKDDTFNYLLNRKISATEWTK